MAYIRCALMNSILLQSRTLRRGLGEIVFKRDRAKQKQLALQIPTRELMRWDEDDDDDQDADENKTRTRTMTRMMTRPRTRKRTPRDKGEDEHEEHGKWKVERL